MTCTDCLMELVAAHAALNDGLADCQAGRARVDWIMPQADRLSAAIGQMVLCQKGEDAEQA